MIEPSFEPRPTCARCGRPVSVCYCAHLVTLEPKTRVVVLQHPREHDIGIGTARMASLCLRGSEVHVGVRFGGTAGLRSALGDPARPAVLLYPGEGAIDVAEHPPPGPITLVVVDGTWAHARSIVRHTPELAALPRYSFRTPKPSEYRIRKEPDEAYLSTIESLAHVLGVLEGDPEGYARLYAPFRAMVEAQLAHARTSPGGRHKRRRAGPRPPKDRVPPIFAARANDLVVVGCEVNAWPIGSPERPTPHDPGELVHLVAARATGERFDVVVATERTLSSSTPIHTELDRAALEGGVSLPVLRERWAAFVRPSDVLVTWGTHTPKALRAAGLAWPGEMIDLRKTARVMASRRVGPIEALHATLGVTGTAPIGRGRAGRRLAMAHDITTTFVRRAAASSG